MRFFSFQRRSQLFAANKNPAQSTAISTEKTKTEKNLTHLPATPTSNPKNQIKLVSDESVEVRFWMFLRQVLVLSRQVLCQACCAMRAPKPVSVGSSRQVLVLSRQVLSGVFGEVCLWAEVCHLVFGRARAFIRARQRAQVWAAGGLL